MEPRAFLLDSSQIALLRGAAKTLVALGVLVPVALLLVAWQQFSPGMPRAIAAAVAAVFFVILVLSATVIFRVAGRVRLELDDDGITFWQVNYSVRARWRDVTRVGLVPSGMVYVEGLILRESEVRGNRLGRIVAAIGRQDLAIPLTPFSFRWRDDELGATLRARLPDLPGLGLPQ